MARKYSPSASKDVEREMHKFKRGELKSGRRNSKESQAGHCDRTFRGAKKGQEGPQEEGQLALVASGCARARFSSSLLPAPCAC
jgi:hypothetical protein